MRIFLNGAFTAALLGALWMMVLSITFAVAAAFASGAAFRPDLLLSLLWGLIGGLAVIYTGVLPKTLEYHPRVLYTYPLLSTPNVHT